MYLKLSLTHWYARELTRILMSPAVGITKTHNVMDLGMAQGGKTTHCRINSEGQAEAQLSTTAMPMRRPLFRRGAAKYPWQRTSQDYLTILSFILFLPEITASNRLLHLKRWGDIHNGTQHRTAHQCTLGQQMEQQMLLPHFGPACVGHLSIMAQA